MYGHKCPIKRLEKENKEWTEDNPTEYCNGCDEEFHVTKLYECEHCKDDGDEYLYCHSCMNDELDNHCHKCGNEEIREFCYG